MNYFALHPRTHDLLFGLQRKLRNAESASNAKKVQCASDCFVVEVHFDGQFGGLEEIGHALRWVGQDAGVFEAVKCEEWRIAFLLP